MTTPSTILIADDDIDIRDLVVFKLERAGHTVEAVGDGLAAQEAVRSRRYDLVILDIMMPGKSGLDVLREMRAEPGLSRVPVVLLTARSRDVDVDAGFSSGADDYVIKPFSPRELVSRIEALLAKTAVSA